MEAGSDRSLAGLLEAATRRAAGATAVVEPGVLEVSYGELHGLTLGVSGRLKSLGVVPGDRVALLLPKSAAAVAAILGTLQAGAVYVPLDPSAPAARNAAIVRDCSARAVIARESLARPLAAELGGRAVAVAFPINPAQGDQDVFLDLPEGRAGTDSGHGPDGSPPAYILYTSGSTGGPKGVLHSHRGALSFVDWCVRHIGYGPEERFASHAPFHFDLSVHDLFVALHRGGAIVLVKEEAARNPFLLSQLIAGEGISVWYSAPSALALLARFGKLDTMAFPRLRLVLFAGEIFPMAQLRRLRALWPCPAYFNLFGPTETNVCTYYPLPRREETDGMVSLPIGRACEHMRTCVADEDGTVLEDGREGELLVSGPAVMQGYFGQPEMTASVFLRDPGGRCWYRTGDRVIRHEDGNHLFLGRRDRMVKRRGYRIELQEIESCLDSHPSVRESAAVAVPGDDGGIRIDAHVVVEGAEAASVIAFKEFCAGRLPLYMVPDRIHFAPRLPRTSTGKIDYRKLAEGD